VLPVIHKVLQRREGDAAEFALVEAGANRALQELVHLHGRKPTLLGSATFLPVLLTADPFRFVLLFLPDPFLGNLLLLSSIHRDLLVHWH